IVLRVEKKLFTIEQPISPAPVAGASNQELEDLNKIYDIHNEVACLILGSCDVSWKKTKEYTKIWSLNEEVNSSSRSPDICPLFWP
ncbi:hypothetical protein Tco_1460370, partial [Tanacetum coccineum]